jgi:hypothetical protein
LPDCQLPISVIMVLCIYRRKIYLLKLFFKALHLCLLSTTLHAQNETAKTMETRARDMHKAIVSNDKAQWKKFIRENYTQALINKPMRAQKATNEDGVTSNSSENVGTNVDAKAEMFAQLHDDFGSSEIVSIKVEDEKTTMVLRKGQLTGIFTLRFENKSPWLIDGIGIEVN